MELVELHARYDEAAAEAKAAQKKADKRRDARDDDEAATSDDSEDDRRKKKGNKAANKPKKESAKAFALRSTLPEEILAAAVLGFDAEEPATETRLDEDAKAALGDGSSAEMQDWKRGDDAVFDWKTGPDQRTVMGVLYIILALILVNERVLTDGTCQVACQTVFTLSI